MTEFSRPTLQILNQRDEKKTKNVKTKALVEDMTTDKFSTIAQNAYTPYRGTQ